MHAVQGERGVSELAALHGAHPTMTHQWKVARLGALHAGIGDLAVAHVHHGFTSRGMFPPQAIAAFREDW